MPLESRRKTTWNGDKTVTFLNKFAAGMPITSMPVDFRNAIEEKDTGLWPSPIANYIAKIGEMGVARYDSFLLRKLVPIITYLSSASYPIGGA